jgi:hypothetical protein
MKLADADCLLRALYCLFYQIVELLKCIFLMLKVFKQWFKQSLIGSHEIL